MRAVPKFRAFTKQLENSKSHMTSVGHQLCARSDPYLKERGAEVLRSAEFVLHQLEANYKLLAQAEVNEGCDTWDASTLATSGAGKSLKSDGRQCSHEQRRLCTHHLELRVFGRIKKPMRHSHEESQSLCHVACHLCVTPPGSSSYTLLQERAFQHNGAVLRESRCARTLVKSTAFRDSLEPLACVDTATRRIQYQQWKHHG